MANKIMKTKYGGTCLICGKRIDKWTKIVYVKGVGIKCLSHDTSPFSEPELKYEPMGLTLSRFDRYGVYTIDGQKIGATCNCEDYPCCGH